jgi:putative tricarboxylic transport membrane protein
MPFMVVLGLWGARVWVRLTQVPKSVIAAIVAGICLLGTYAEGNDIFAVWTAAVFGVIGYVLRKVHIHPAPIVLALVLGYMMESNLRRAMLQSGNDLMVFVVNPIAAVCLVMALLVLVLPFSQGLWRRPRVAPELMVGD